MTVLIVPDRGLPGGGRDRVTGKNAWGARVLMARGSTPIPASAIRIKSARSPLVGLGHADRLPQHPRRPHAGGALLISVAAVDETIQQ